MKKQILIASLLAFSFQSPAFAEPAGGIEFSGNTSVLTGWQHDDGGVLVAPGGILVSPGGGLGDVRGLRSPDRDTFNFYLDEFELSIGKELGEKIRIRADLDFGRALSGSTRSTEGSNFVIEQAYVTVGILAGEFAIGRFNAPVGYYVVDRAENPTISFSNIYNFLTPTSVTGAKMYWDFDNGIDLSVYMMNQMFDCLQIGGSCLVGPPSSADSAVPSWGLRLGYNWGTEEKPGTVGLAYMGGPEQAANNAHLDHLFDLDFSFYPMENLLLAGELIYYQRNNLPGVLGPNGKFAGGLLVVDWQVSELFDLFFSYGYVHDFQGVVTGVDQQVHNALVGFGYQITDDAKFKFEYRFDYFQYAKVQDTRTAAGAINGAPFTVADTDSWSHTVVGSFNYFF